MLRAFRPINLIVIILVCVAFQIASQKDSSSGISLSLDFTMYTIISVLVGASGYLINGLFDKEIDKENLNEYEFPFTSKLTYIIYALLTLGACTLSVFFFSLNTVILFVILPIFLLWFYSNKLKRLPIIGNLAVTFLSLWLPIGLLWVNGALPLIEGAISTQYIFLMISEIALITLVREIIKDIQDIKGDQKYGCKTLPILIGENKAAIVASFFLFWSSLLWFGSLTKNWSDLSILPIILSIITFFIILISFIMLWLDNSWHERAKKSSLMLKVGMFSALLTLIFI